MSFLVWPPWLEVTAGGLGVIAALWSISRRQAGKPMHPDAAKADTWLLVFGALLAGIGLVHFFDL